MAISLLPIIVTSFKYVCLLYFIVWIVKLGPPNYGEERLYSYLITSSMNLKSWFVLVRDIGEFQDIHDIGVKEWLKDKNFSDPYTVNQPRECVYPEVMEEP